MPVENQSRTTDMEEQLKTLMLMMAEKKVGQDELEADMKAVQVVIVVIVVEC